MTQDLPKFTIGRDALLPALAELARMADKRGFVPALEHAACTIAKGVVHMATTDLDTHLAATLPVAETINGFLSFPAAKVLATVKSLPKGAELCLRTVTDGVELISGRTRATFPVLPVEDFPNLQGPVGDPAAFELPAATLLEALATVRGSISTEETRYYLNGAFMHCHADGLRVVATDGHKLSMWTGAKPAGCTDMPGVLVHTVAVDAVMRLAKLAKTKQVAIATSTKQIRFTLPGWTLTSKLVDGTFPDYQRVIPSYADKSIWIGKAEMSAALARVAGTDWRNQLVRFEVGGSEIVLTHKSDGGTAVETVAADTTKGVSYPVVGFNAGYLRILLAAVPGERVELCMADGGSPVIIRERMGAPILHVLMPIRT